jgi:hypothetical protein
VEAHRARVNPRRVIFTNDAVTLFPCAGGGGRRGLPACARAPVPTTSPAAPRTAWTDYRPIYGTVAFGAEHLPIQRDAWARTSRLQLTTAAAAHSCAYTCLLSGYASTRAGTRCLLEAPPEGGADAQAAASHTFCPGFPAEQQLPAPLAWLG